MTLGVMTSPTEPLSPEEDGMTFVTEAGRRLAAWSADDRPVPPDDWLGSILDIEQEAMALARSEPVPGLDVERLARAWHLYWRHGVEVPGDATDREWAEAFAAEYAALSPTEAE